MSTARTPPATNPLFDTPTSPSEQTLRAVVADFDPIALAEVLDTAALQTRTDRKYFVPAATFRTFVELMGDELVALDIYGQRLFDYESIYFDSPDMGTYRAHVQRRRRRFKVRTRTYLDSGECMLEVKLEGRRAATVKHRIAYPLDQRGRLTSEGDRYLAELLAEAYGVVPPTDLRPVLITRYHRATLVCRNEPARLTCDVDLMCNRFSGSSRAQPRLRAAGDHVLVESKSVGGSVADRVLRQMGVRATTVSKYCVGIAGLHPELTSNPWRRTLRRYFTLEEAA